VQKPDTNAARALCRQIRVRTARYTSFRALSLVLLAAVAVIMAALNGILPHYFSKAPGRSGKHEVAEWEGYDFFHLIRFVCKARGIAPWDRRDRTVPTMRDRYHKFALHARAWNAPGDASLTDI
jgi:hypothetical protein